MSNCCAVLRRSAPLIASGFCLAHFQSELEDLSFMYAHGEEYRNLKERVATLCKEQEEVMLEVMLHANAQQKWLLKIKKKKEKERKKKGIDRILSLLHNEVDLSLCRPLLVAVIQGKRVLMETIDKDQFLGYITVDVEVRTHYKELYRCVSREAQTDAYHCSSCSSGPLLLDMLRDLCTVLY